jgi:hypothetical protein
MADTIVFTRREDGTVTVDGFPPRIQVAASLVAQASNQSWSGLHVNGRDLRIDVANGSAVYRLRYRPDDPRTFDAVRKPVRRH